MKRAWSFGIRGMICPTDRFEDLHKTIEICNKYENVYTSVGCVMPTLDQGNTNREEMSEQQIQKSVSKIQEQIEKEIEVDVSKKIVMIGICTLEIKDSIEKDYQISLFKMHFDLAEKYSKPILFKLKESYKTGIDLIWQNRHKFNYGMI